MADLGFIFGFGERQEARLLLQIAPEGSTLHFGAYYPFFCLFCCLPVPVPCLSYLYLA